MFEKLFTLVKNNAGTAIIDNPLIPQKYHEAVINDASSTIIEVLKNQMENGKIKDLVKYFQFSGVYDNPLIASAIHKFANKLNNFYGIEPKPAIAIANGLIRPVMQELIRQSKSAQNNDFALSSLLALLNVNKVNVNGLISQIAL